MSRRLIYVALLTLAACARPVSVPGVDQAKVPLLPVAEPPSVAAAVVANQTLPEAVASAAPSIGAPVEAAQALVQAIADPTPVLPPPPEPAEAACHRAAASLIVRWEVTSPAYYARRLQTPIWPRGQSGVTWGIGYDGGHQTGQVIRLDWQGHEHVDRLATTAGITGNRANQVVGQYRDIVTRYDYAYQVFEERSVIEYHRQARRAFRDGFDSLSPNACAAIVDLVYNRGVAMSGDSRREMRALRDTCIPKQDYPCMAREIRSMTRLWRGTVNEAGLTARRESEARLIEEN